MFENLIDFSQANALPEPVAQGQPQLPPIPQGQPPLIADNLAALLPQAAPMQATGDKPPLIADTLNLEPQKPKVKKNDWTPEVSFKAQSVYPAEAAAKGAMMANAKSAPSSTGAWGKPE